MNKNTFIDMTNEISLDTEIYKYMSLQSFLYLFQCHKIVFNKISNWPDAYEGGRFDLYKRIYGDINIQDIKIDNLFGCCWTFEEVDSRLFYNSHEFEKANNELKKLGSAAMWESYCKNGGIRIKTTIRKLLDVIDNNEKYQFKCYKGKIKYEAASSISINPQKTYGAISAFFIKRMPFIYESEYRFLLENTSEQNHDTLEFDIENFFDFIDEFLISPSVIPNKWLSRSIYSLVVNKTSRPGFGINKKNDKQFCRISGLYGHISEEV